MTVILMRKQSNEDGSVEGIAQQMRTPASVFINKVTVNLPKDTTHCIRFGCTGNIPGRQDDGIRVINSAKAIHRVFDKAGFRQLLNKDGLCPKTWDTINQLLNSDFNLHQNGVIIRPTTHMRGRELYLSYDMNTASRVCERLNNEYYIQEHINKDKEFRVHVVQGRVVSVFQKIPKIKNALVWNDADTVNIRWSQWPIDVLHVAREAFLLSNLHFGAVDVIVDQAGRAYVLEINTCPELTPYFQQCFALAFDWMVDNNLYDKDVGVSFEPDWKTFIHPCMTNLAR